MLFGFRSFYFSGFEKGSMASGLLLASCLDRVGCYFWAPAGGILSAHLGLWLLKPEQSQSVMPPGITTVLIPFGKSVLEPHLDMFGPCFELGFGIHFWAPSCKHFGRHFGTSFELPWVPISGSIFSPCSNPKRSETFKQMARPTTT